MTVCAIIVRLGRRTPGPCASPLSMPWGHFLAVGLSLSSARSRHQIYPVVPRHHCVRSDGTACAAGARKLAAVYRDVARAEQPSGRPAWAPTRPAKSKEHHNAVVFPQRQQAPQHPQAVKIVSNSARPRLKAKRYAEVIEAFGGRKWNETCGCYLWRDALLAGSAG
jgi:hypothetical protein